MKNQGLGEKGLMEVGFPEGGLVKKEMVGSGRGAPKALGKGTRKTPRVFVEFLCLFFSVI